METNIKPKLIKVTEKMQYKYLLSFAQSLKGVPSFGIREYYITRYVNLGLKVLFKYVTQEDGSINFFILNDENFVPISEKYFNEILKNYEIIKETKCSTCL